MIEKIKARIKGYGGKISILENDFKYSDEASRMLIIRQNIEIYEHQTKDLELMLELAEKMEEIK